ncbi:universal stress protein [Streptomyces sp. NPDC002004]
MGVDGSNASLDALDWAVDEAVRRNVPLRVLYSSRWVWYEGHAPSFDTGRGPAQSYAHEIADQAVERATRRSTVAKVTGEVRWDDPAAALIEASQAACAVVVGNRGRGGLSGLLLGSVGLSVAAHAESPVIVVRGGEKNRLDTFGQVVVGVDEAPEAAAVIGFAARTAEQRGAALRAVHAWRRPAHEGTGDPNPDDLAARAEEQVAHALERAGVAMGPHTVSGEAIEGSASTVLLEASAAADLLVVGARRKKGNFGMQLGTVNHAVLHHAACPVALVPHT